MNRKRLATAAAIVALVTPSFAGATGDQESEIGAQVYAKLKSQGEMITKSPYYAVLNPIAAKIKTVADDEYAYPFHFILVHEKNPNAFAVPGGNVYVTDSLMKFVENRDELAGVLCHETSHDIHHDVFVNMQKDQRLQLEASAIGALLGNMAGGVLAGAVNYAAKVQALTYSRRVETAADIKGAETCAQAGYNPWGMVWLFNHFEKADSHGGMEMLSDHPTNSHRVDDLERYFEQHPRLFSRYTDNIDRSPKLNIPHLPHVIHTPPPEPKYQDYSESPPPEPPHRMKPATTQVDDELDSNSVPEAKPTTRPRPVHHPSYDPEPPPDNDVPRFP